MKSKTLSHIVATSMCFVIGGVMFSGAYYNKFKEDTEEKEYRQAAITADTNRDGVTSVDEWIKVYQELGVHYDAANPEPLSPADIKKYNSRHNLSKKPSSP